jgi:cephalosporin hydroxylase
MSEYEFTEAWFQQTAKSNWDSFIPRIRPKTILEIGSFEGASVCYLIDMLGTNSDLEVHCVDSWEGGVEHQKGGEAEVDMVAAEARFHHNVKLAIGNAKNLVDLHIHKGRSDECLAQLVAMGKSNFFDFIYIDGSHQAPDVLCDAVLAFRLLKVGGHMAFDDYLYSEDLPYGIDLIRCPKPAIDAFTNLYGRKIRILKFPVSQLYLKKISS